MKKTLSIFLAIILLLWSLVACKQTEILDNPDSNPEKKQEEPKEEIVFNENDIYVAIDGDDMNSGTKDSPLASFAAAKEKAKSVIGKENITVWFREGTYYLDETISFDETDRENVTYSGFPNETVIISGGKEITGWQPTEINGITAWVADVPQGEDFMALYGKDGHLSTTFYPEDTYLMGKPVSNTDKQLFQIDITDMLDFITDEGIFIRIENRPWDEQINQIISVDIETGIISADCGTQSLGLSNVSYRYRLENIKSMLKTPGQWYLDVTESKVYYVPQNEENIDGFTLVYGNLIKLIDAIDIDNISFSNLTFSDTRRDRVGRVVGQGCFQLNPALAFSAANNITFDGCTIRNTGYNGLYFGSYSRDCCVTNCHFVSIGATACNVTNSSVHYTEDMTGNFTFKNNLVERFSRVYQHGEGLLIGHCDGAEVSNNTIHDGYYTGISCGWVWGLGESPTNNIKVTHNLIYDIGQGCLSDMGGIYMLGSQPGSALMYNTIYNVSHCDYQGTCFDGSQYSGGYGGNGIFLDEGSSNMEVKYNLIYDVTGGAVAKNQEGPNLYITNNIFAFTSGMPKITSNVFNNLFISDNPETDFMYVNPSTSMNGMENYCFNYSGYYKNECVFASYYDENPGFVDYEKRNFSLKDNSALYDFEGFELWDYFDVGCNFEK